MNAVCRLSGHEWQWRFTRLADGPLSPTMWFCGRCDLPPQRETPRTIPKDILQLVRQQRRQERVGVKGGGFATWRKGR